MKSRHKAHKASGGVVYEGAGSNVVKEAHEKEAHKRGGRVMKHVGKVVGEKAKHRADKRARGGRVSGSDKAPFAPGAGRHPFSSAHKGG